MKKIIVVLLLTIPFVSCTYEEDNSLYCDWVKVITPAGETRVPNYGYSEGDIISTPIGQGTVVGCTHAGSTPGAV
ncbi:MULTISPECIES: hypothetical protein [Flammeovirga]|uniref:Lipoprotein n=1 Tax=Flammeovirga agarivorans TaxID=2726742 RepID=A0A7X8SQA7_9BACT|nr:MULTISPECIES: hypothetical protein [Flammeovirga]NLR94436.1 hypothetical protein [Flammeovirga agarivorans]